MRVKIRIGSEVISIQNDGAGKNDDILTTL